MTRPSWPLGLALAALGAWAVLWTLCALAWPVIEAVRRIGTG